MERPRELLALVLVLAAALTAAGNEPSAEHWYDVTLNGVSMGYSHEWVETGADGAIITGTHTRMLVSRGGDVVRLEVTERWAETAAGSPLEYHMSMQASDRETTLDLVIQGDSASLRRAVGADATTTDLVIPAGLTFPAAAKRLISDGGDEPGTRVSYVGFDAETEAVATYALTVEGTETIDPLGRNVEVTRYTVECDARPGLPAREWRDADANLWKYELPSTGMALSRTTKEHALAEREAFDLLTASAVSSNVTIRAPYQVDDALFEIWLDDGTPVDEFIVEDARQTIEGRTERGVLLRVTRVAPDEDSASSFPVSDGTMRDDMEGSPLMQTWYPRILGVASRQAWGTDRNIWKASRNIESWVFHEVKKKGFGTGFASATETLDTREGDCSEHAVLMAAMVRSLSIPARLASGLLHHQGAFLYHMWVEVWTGDGWYALDPTIGDGSVDAMHIKFAESSAKRGNVSDLALGILRVFGRVNIRIVEYTEGGRVVRP